MELSEITKEKRWCGFCTSNDICDNEKCKTCRDKSFASNPKSIHWSPKNTILPRFVYKSTSSKFLFDCNTCGHEFSIQLNNITNKNSWCQFCVNKKLCDDEKCIMCRDKSFASNPKSICWSKKNTILPRFVFRSHTKKIIFDCNICGHEFSMTLNGN